MAFLCLKHRQYIAQHETRAEHLWRGAIASGLKALNQCRLPEARASFGVAYEIAKIRLLCPTSGEPALFSPLHLSQAASHLCEVLRLMDDDASAEQCLLEQHYLLLLLGADTAQPVDRQRQARHLAETGLVRVEALLLRNNQAAKAKSLRLVTQRLGQQATVH